MRRLCVPIALLALCLVPASAGAFAGASVRGGSFPTSWAAQALLIRVACPAATQSTPRPGDFSFCRGEIHVFSGGREVASAPFSVRTFDSHVEKVRVRPGARRMFRPGRRIGLRWVIRSHDGRGQWATRSGRVTLFNPYSRL